LGNVEQKEQPEEVDVRPKHVRDWGARKMMYARFMHENLRNKLLYHFVATPPDYATVVKFIFADLASVCRASERLKQLLGYFCANLTNVNLRTLLRKHCPGCLNSIK